MNSLEYTALHSQSSIAPALRRDPIEEIPLSRFAQGRTIWIRRHASSGLDWDEVVRRSRLRLGENRYHETTRART
jgi:hypothetical protein